ncbi:DEKNAAC105572 [Brettanomyces naardenensis]|uniref:Vacuolar ATPase assembly protein VMA22 n=1 Tax=Brettanomyces naardenensis TaxID=13370 RepID=A0A448YU29_BRENA|nr:DEKNAAC105572 [Brettanomyces naardenensis]
MTASYDLLTKYEPASITLTRKQKASVRLVQLLDVYHTEYDELCSELKKASMDVTRANYIGTSNTAKIGKDFWDLRPRLATKTVCICENDEENTFNLVDVTPKEAITNKTDKEEQDVAADKSEEGLTKVQDYVSSETSVVNRKQNANKDVEKPLIMEEDETEVLEVKDPLKMFFGGMVPLPLRRAKKSTDSVLQKIVKLCQIRQELIALTKTLGE